MSWCLGVRQSNIVFVDGVEASRTRHQVDKHNQEGALQEREPGAFCQHRQNDNGSRLQVSFFPKRFRFRLCRRIQDSKMAGPANRKENTELQDFFQQTMMEENDGKWRPFPGACSTYWLPFSDQVKHSFTLMT